MTLVLRAMLRRVIESVYTRMAQTAVIFSITKILLVAKVASGQILSQLQMYEAVPVALINKPCELSTSLQRSFVFMSALDITS
jgi:hypothetical protein